jgi:hypothetical protein
MVQELVLVWVKEKAKETVMVKVQCIVAAQGP